MSEQEVAQTAVVIPELGVYAQKNEQVWIRVHPPGQPSLGQSYLFRVGQRPPDGGVVVHPIAHSIQGRVRIADTLERMLESKVPLHVSRSPG